MGYEITNWLSSGSGRPVSPRTRTPRSIYGDGVTMANPTLSLPRRPARPAICPTSATLKSVKSWSRLTPDCVRTTVLAGKSTPAANVVVANTASRHPRRMSSSTAIFHDGRCPA